MELTELRAALAVATPAEWVRRMLEVAREQGAPFEQAWTQTLLILRCEEVDKWREALAECRLAFARAYDGEPPSRAEAALWRLAGGRELAELPSSERVCAHCGGSLAGRTVRAVFCSAHCRRQLNYAIERERGRRISDGRKVAAEGGRRELPTGRDAASKSDSPVEAAA